MRTFVLLTVLVMMIVPAASLYNAAAEQQDPVADALVRLYVIHRDGDNWRSSGFAASGFLLDEQGTVLTDGMLGDLGGPNYRVIALRRGELFGAALVCAPVTGLIPWPARDEELKKKIAVFKLNELDWPNFAAWVYHPPNEQPVVIARPHRGKLPAFRPLAIGDDPKEGDRVRIAAYGGYDQLFQHKPVPEPWSAQGHVTRVFKGADGLPLFEADFDSKDWQSGAVIVQADDRVTGLSVWKRYGAPPETVAISASALREPCRPELSLPTPPLVPQWSSAGSAAATGGLL